jgi:hypothetical protein
MIHNRWLVILLACMAATLAAAPSSAETIAEFADGMTNAAVDGYVGMGGGGWAGPWVEGVSSTAPPTVTKQILTTNPLNDQDPPGNDNYLNVQVDGLSAASKFFSTGRDYKGIPGIDTTLPYTIDFKYRVDETLTGGTFTNFNDRYQLFDSTQTSVSSGASWSISCYGGTGTGFTDTNMVGKWVVYDGGGHDLPVDTGFVATRQVNTGVTVTTGTIYDMHVAVDPTDYTYDVTISSGTTLLYDSVTANGGAYATGLGWRTSATTSPGFIRFLGNVDQANDLRNSSLDSIRIVPEPSTLLMVVLGGMVLAGVSRRRG